ncbi:hypothetical protein [Streptomyces sp. NPDC046909]|uniref:hypothetical protein n=1 Tax=Streptomyces sp. NPDC046909 TaxID=3155617 RepID=UPI0033C7C02B
MRVTAPRPKRLALGIAALTAITLGTVSASAAQATGPSSTDTHPKSTAFAVAYHPTENAPDDVNTANEDFAACMRKQGEESFPDFHATKDEEGRVQLQVKAGAPEKSLKPCAPILKKAGITFPNPTDLPPLPGKPGT